MGNILNTNKANKTNVVLALRRKFYFIFIFSMILGSFLFFGLAGHASATTYYVDTATGDDGRTTAQAISLSTPWKTMVKAETAAADGDTIRVISGTYVEPSAVGGSTGNISFTKALAWISDDGSGNPGVVIVRRASGASVAYFKGTKATSWTGFTFDGEGTADYILLGQSAPQSNKTWTNVTFKDAQNTSGILMRFYSTAGTNNQCINCVFTGSGLKGVTSDNSPIVLINPTFSMTYSSSKAIVGGPDSISITNGSITLSGSMSFVELSSSQASLDITGVTINSSSSNKIIIISSDVPISITGSTITTANYLLYATTVVSTWVISDNTITYSGTNDSGIIYRKPGSMTISDITSEISNNVININSQTDKVIYFGGAALCF